MVLADWIFLRIDYPGLPLLPLIQVMIHLVCFHSSFQAFHIATQLAVCAVVLADGALSRAKDTPEINDLNKDSIFIL